MLNAQLLQTLNRITPEEEAALRREKIDKSLYTDQGGFTIDNRKMLHKGTLITLRPHTRFVDFPRHNHNYVEMMYVCTGSVTHTIDGRHTVVLRPGELLLLSCNASHEIKRAARGDVAVNFIVLPQFFDTAYEMIDHDNILSQFVAQNLRGEGGRISYLHFRVSDVRPVQNLVENLVMDTFGRQPNRRNICSITMGLLFLQLLNYTEHIDLQESQQAEDARLTIAVLREIEENYRAASLTALAQKHGSTVYALSKLIRQETGKTYKQVLQDKRFSKALQLLATTSLPVADISRYVGYENISYFHRQFRARYRVSPAAYRDGSVGK